MSTFASRASICCCICACSSANFSTAFISVSLPTSNSTSFVWSALDTFWCFGAFEFSINSLCVKNQKNKWISRLSPPNTNWMQSLGNNFNIIDDGQQSLLGAHVCRHFLCFNLVFLHPNRNKNPENDCRLHVRQEKFVFIEFIAALPNDIYISGRRPYRESSEVGHKCRHTAFTSRTITTKRIQWNALYQSRPNIDSSLNFLLNS